MKEREVSTYPSLEEALKALAADLEWDSLVFGMGQVRVSLVSDREFTVELYDHIHGSWFRAALVRAPNSPSQS